MVRLRPTVLAGALLLGGATASAGEVGVAVQHARLTELSGLALSRLDPSVLWGHNDTGSGPVLYRIGLDGRDLGTARVPEAMSGDWEDIASFEDAGGPALLIADVGDNLAFRTHVTLYAVRDPGRRRDAPLLWRLDFTFPDGPRDCEAVAVDPVAREILLISKRDRPPVLYRLPLPTRTPGRRLVAERLGEIRHLPPVTWRDRLRAPVASQYAHSPTALDVSRDGREAVIVTPWNAYRYRRGAAESWREVFARPGQVIPLPALEQIEAVAFSADGAELYVGSEGRPSRIARLALPR